MKDNIYYLKNSRYKKLIIKWALIIFFILVVLSFFLYYIFFRTPRVTEVRHGEFVDGFSTRALLVRNEEVVETPQAGELTLLRKEGERLHSGQRVASLSSRGEDVYMFNRRPGLISFSIDGLEELSPEKAKDLSPEEFESFDRNFRQRVDGDYIGKGQPVFRIIDNNLFYVVVETARKEADRYRVNEEVFVTSRDLEGRVEGRIRNISVSSEQALIIVELKRFIDKWLSSRWVQIEFIKNIHSGFVIPRGAVFNQPEGRGVLVRDSHGNLSFKRVEIQRENREEALVEGVDIGDEVVVNPETVDYGRE
ncbi:MAG: HlyD family efflux transporter periplasmic adaptor subunit [Halanaerobiaceae bacterium]